MSKKVSAGGFATLVLPPALVYSFPCNPLPPPSLFTQHTHTYTHHTQTTRTHQHRCTQVTLTHAHTLSHTRACTQGMSR